MAQGRVYFVQAEAGGPIKIGFATDVWSRVKTLQTSHHEKLICLVHIAGTMDDEQLLHQEYAAHRLNGEWFSDCEEIRSLVERASEHATAQCATPPAKKNKEAKPRKKMSAVSRDLFKLMAEESFGKAGLAKKLAAACGVTSKGAENLLVGKCDPQFDTMTTMFRSEPTMFLWFMATVVMQIIAEQRKCSEEDALLMLREYPDAIPAIFVGQIKSQTRTAIDILYLAANGLASGPSLEYLDDYCRTTTANYEKMVAGRQDGPAS